MNSAKERRLSKLFNPEYGRGVTIPIDHGLLMGNVEGLEDPVGMIEKLIDAGIDSTLMSYGIGKITNEYFSSTDAPARILTCDYPLAANVPGQMGSFTEYDMLYGVEEALKWGFDAVKVALIWGFDKSTEMKQIKAIGNLAKECDKWDFPLMIEPVMWGDKVPESDKNNPDIIKHGCRIALELGADILKAPYTGQIDSFKEVTENFKVPVVVLGGTNMDTNEEIIKTARDSVVAGAKGIVFGRCVWKNEKMLPLIDGLKDAVYKKTDEKEIVKKFNL